MTALFFWILTVVVGGYMFAVVSRYGGHAPQEIRHTRLPAMALLAHPTIGLAGLASWVAHIVTGASWFAWVSVGTLVAGFVLGLLMFARTLKRDEKAIVPRSTDPNDMTVRAAPYAEHEVSHAAIAGHGLLAVITFVLVLLVALGV